MKTKNLGLQRLNEGFKLHIAKQTEILKSLQNTNAQKSKQLEDMKKEISQLTDDIVNPKQKD